MKIEDKIKEYYGKIKQGDRVRFTGDRYLYIFDRIEVIKGTFTKAYAWVKDGRGNVACMGLGVEFPNMYKI